MKMQKTRYNEEGMPLRMRLYKLCIAACVTMMLSLVIFACGGARESSTTTDSAGVIQDTSGAMRDTSTSTMPPDTAAKVPPDSVH
jgi:hypothetical protein